MEQPIQWRCMASLVTLCCCILSVNGFLSVTPSTSSSFQYYNLPHQTTFHPKMTIDDESDDGNNASDEILFQSTVKIDDGGSDLTDRFKYKVLYREKDFCISYCLFFKISFHSRIFILILLLSNQKKGQCPHGCI